MLKVDKKGNILRPNGTVLGKPNRNYVIRRSNARTGRIDENGNVYNLKDECIGQVDMSKFDIYNSPKKEKVSTKKVSTKKKNATPVVAAKRTESKMAAPEVTTKKPEPEYHPGLDSELLVSGKFSKMYYKPVAPGVEDKALAEINAKHKWKYDTWEELSRKENLSDAELDKYELYVSWFDFLYYHPDREFDEKYRKKFRTHLTLRVLDLIPYNGKIVNDNNYKAASIKDDRKKADRVKELKEKREARKKMKSEV